MKTLRLLFSILLALLLALTLILGIPSTSAFQQIVSAKSVKTWLSNSNFYPGLIDLAFDQLKKETVSGEQIENLLLSNEQILTAVKRSIPTDFVQESVETIVDAYYDYWNGRKEKVEFTISLEAIETSFTTKIPQILKETIAALPPCPGNTDRDLEQFRQGQCLPPAISQEEVDGAIEQVIASSDQIFENPNLTEIDLAINYDKLQDGRAAFSIFRKVPWLSFLCALLLSAAILSLPPRRKSGFLLLGITWGASTALVLGFTVIAKAPFFASLQDLLLTQSSPDEIALTNTMVGVLETAYNAIIDRILLLSAVGLLFGISCIAIAKVRVNN